MTTRLDRLRQVREWLKSESRSDDLRRELIEACSPADRSEALKIDMTWDMRVLVSGMWISDPLTSVDGALWLAKQALPGWPPQLQPECGVWPAICEWRLLTPAVKATAPTLPLAICRAVVSALIAQEEREVVG